MYKPAHAALMLHPIKFMVAEREEIPNMVISDRAGRWAPPTCCSNLLFSRCSELAESWFKEADELQQCPESSSSWQRKNCTKVRRKIRELNMKLEMNRICTLQNCPSAAEKGTGCQFPLWCFHNMKYEITYQSCYIKAFERAFFHGAAMLYVSHITHFHLKAVCAHFLSANGY